MSAAGNVAEQSENVTLWLNEKLSLAENGRNNNNSNGNKNNVSNSNKYIAPSSTASPKMCPSSSNSNNRSNSITNVNNNHKEFNELCKKVQSGHKIMIIMRGASGSGKSTLAKSLLQQTGLLQQYGIQDFICSSDDYFNTQRGYQFNPNFLPDAHEWNQQRVAQKAATGWSPIIVDNTNMMIWEMQPYVQKAVQHNYIVELLEPQTGWCKSASKLAQKNTHQVPKESIQRMLERYEKANVNLLLGLLKETKYTKPLPQMRLQPPLSALPSLKPQSLQAKNSDANNDAKGNATTAPKLNVNAQNWVPYEQNAPSYWAQLDEQKIQTPIGGNASSGYASSLADLLRDEQTAAVAATSSSDAINEPLQRHSINCPNEAYGFGQLRQMYPNKQVAGLWDLYVKCNGDLDWTVDILLKEDELNGGSPDYDNEELNNDEFQCACNGSNNLPMQTASVPNILTSTQSSKSIPKAQRQPRAKRNAGNNAGNSKELQLHVENCFVLGDEQYSEHTRKIRDIRNGILDQPLPPPPPVEQISAAGDDDDDDAEDNALLELTLSETIIKELNTHFQMEGQMLPIELELLPTTVFMPRHVAKQIYMVYVEAALNQQEEQRHQTMRDDEQFARLLKNPKYAECTESPVNLNELLDMELALQIYNSEQQAASQATHQKPNDIATHLTKMMLCDKFPEIPKETVLEIFAAKENNYVKTLEVLDSDLKSNRTGAELYEQAIRENEKLIAQEQQQQKPAINPRSSPRAGVSKSQSPQLLHEEAKSAALRDFEETRNLAAHHSQLRAECYLKAKQAIQQGNGSVALYYSEIAQLHKKKNDVFNNRAANCIMEVHKHTQNNPDLLDLHYLHAMEAVSCLDLFLDRHITVLRNIQRVYKHLFIITGRGLHSANGVSTIKKRVKARLAERRLRWLEVNPGLLRVKVFSASRHSNNF
ncbi:uncharacterized protein LOC117567428 [Drosophila albomicans]|uniref:Uncharacterized protein LOC117567428 n=1 Tax=Drosophila albomicans TaxID=7291 RepID=A0A6P8WV64_DROAB|nr:uncharacterized protein LOC117567428 [Drosophila albomicans]